MKYICAKRFDGLDLQGHRISVPLNSTLNAVNNVIIFSNRPVCMATSQVAYDHFAVDDDGQGRNRFALTHGILKDVEKMKSAHDTAYFAIVNDKHITAEEIQSKLAKLGDKPQAFFSSMKGLGFGHFLKPTGYWSHLFFNGGISELERLDELLKEAM